MTPIGSHPHNGKVSPRKKDPIGDESREEMHGIVKLLRDVDNLEYDSKRGVREEKGRREVDSVMSGEGVSAMKSIIWWKTKEDIRSSRSVHSKVCTEGVYEMGVPY